jgi:hypothetical protein
MSKAIKLLLYMYRIPRSPIPAVSFLLVMTLVSASIFVTARLKIGHRSSDVNHESSSSVTNERRVQIVRFTLYDAGIYPQEARATSGRLTISIEDLTGAGSGVIVERVEETRRVPVGAVNNVVKRLRSRAELNLPIGRYELVDATRPENRASLIVDP